MAVQNLFMYPVNAFGWGVSVAGEAVEAEGSCRDCQSLSRVPNNKEATMISPFMRHNFRRILNMVRDLLCRDSLANSRICKAKRVPGWLDTGLKVGGSFFVPCGIVRKRTSKDRHLTVIPAAII